MLFTWFSPRRMRAYVYVILLPQRMIMPLQSTQYNPPEPLPLPVRRRLRITPAALGDFAARTTSSPAAALVFIARAIYLLKIMYLFATCFRNKSIRWKLKVKILLRWLIFSRANHRLCCWFYSLSRVSCFWWLLNLLCVLELVWFQPCQPQ